MASEYGTIFDTSDIKRQLKDANRDYYGRKTWEGLYSGIDTAEKQQINTLHQDYSKAISDAYAAAYQNKQAIAASNIGQGYKAAAIDENNIALQEAFDSYRKNYLESKSKIETASNEAREQIDTALTEQAEYTRRFANTSYGYLSYLFDKYSEGKDSENIFYNNDLWKRYTTDEVDEEGNPTGEKRLLTWEELKTPSYDKFEDKFGNTTKEWTSLFDDAGNLTLKGADFYDQMFNYEATHGGYSFGEWLNQNDTDLYDWATSYNPYNYTDAGTNFGSFKTMVGLTSKDQTYSFIERFGGMSRKELDSMYSTFTDKAEELGAKVDDGTNSKDLLKDYTSLTNDIRKLTDQLGITNDIENEIGMNFNELASKLTEFTNSAEGDVAWQSILAALGGGVEGAGGTASAIKIGTAAAAKIAALKGTAVGLSTASSSIPVVGWIVTAIIAAGLATYAGVSTAEALKANNRSLANQGKELYDALVTNLVQYSYNKQQAKQIGWRNKNK